MFLLVSLFTGLLGPGFGSYPLPSGGIKSPDLFCWQLNFLSCFDRIIFLLSISQRRRCDSVESCNKFLFINLALVLSLYDIMIAINPGELTEHICPSETLGARHDVKNVLCMSTHWNYSTIWKCFLAQFRRYQYQWTADFSAKRVSLRRILFSWFLTDDGMESVRRGPLISQHQEVRVFSVY